MKTQTNKIYENEASSFLIRDMECACAHGAQFAAVIHGVFNGGCDWIVGVDREDAALYAIGMDISLVN